MVMLYYFNLSLPPSVLPITVNATRTYFTFQGYISKKADKSDLKACICFQYSVKLHLWSPSCLKHKSRRKLLMVTAAQFFDSKGEFTETGLSGSDLCASSCDWGHTHCLNIWRWRGNPFTNKKKGLTGEWIWCSKTMPDAPWQTNGFGAQFIPPQQRKFPDGAFPSSYQPNGSGLDLLPSSFPICSNFPETWLETFFFKTAPSNSTSLLSGRTGVHYLEGRSNDNSHLLAFLRPLPHPFLGTIFYLPPPCVWLLFYFIL